MGVLKLRGDAWEILTLATRYVIQKSPGGITVGLHLDQRFYGEAHSAEGDLDQAVRAAYALAHLRRERNGGTASA